MKSILIFVFVLFIAMSCKDNKEYIFNGKNLDGWKIYVEDPSVDPNKFFYVNDGMIETVGVPAGYLRTEKEFKNYKLHLEWRYPEEPLNSGVLLHVTGPDLIWVSHYQAQFNREDGLLSLY